MLGRVLALALLALPACALASSPEASRVVSPATPAPSAAASTALELAAEPGAAADEDVDEDEDPVGNDTSAPVQPSPMTSPLLALSNTELEQRYRKDPSSLGSISVGRAHAGVLINGVQMPKAELWTLLDPGRAWGTEETVEALQRIIGRVHERFADTPALPIGHLSARTGGHLSPHVSHQSGRDADIGYYHRNGVSAFVTATADNLDMERTWALVRAALQEPNVEMILMDRGVQRVLVDYAAKNGADAALLDAAFQIRGKNARAPIRHIKGHANHLHLRFHSPLAEELGRRVRTWCPCLGHPPSRPPAAPTSPATSSTAPATATRW